MTKQMTKVGMDIYVNVDYDEIVKLHDHNGEMTEYVLHHYKHRFEVIDREIKLFMPCVSSIGILTAMNWNNDGLSESDRTYDYCFNNGGLKVEYVVKSIKPVSEQDKYKLWKWRDDEWKKQFYFDDDGHIHQID
jgi:hypothetical protein